MNYKLVALCALLLSAQGLANRDSDNTKINERDRADLALTADQQSSSEGDTTISSRIRRHIMKEKNLSTNAQNVKIITVDGKVTLKGPVNSERERKTVMKCARKVAGAANVTNQMSVATGKLNF